MASSVMGGAGTESDNTPPLAGISPIALGEQSTQSGGVNTEPGVHQSSNLTIRSATGQSVIDPNQVNVYSPNSSLPGIREWVRVVRSDLEFAQVSVVQIERIKTMHDRFKEAARFSFNYNVLLLVASVLAGIGLVSGSSATIIASMLVSPIMGPVAGLAYGTTIRDWKLVRLAARTEIISLFFCVFIGAILAASTFIDSLFFYLPPFSY